MKDIFEYKEKEFHSFNSKPKKIIISPDMKQYIMKRFGSSGETTTLWGVPYETDWACEKHLEFSFS